ncbi:hypothetical protein [Uliginosibacterium sediminicola]|uniref:Uncharacterized protein n=1 Tax=Uliginosibacterium sediminicola TaxID=2024550 RepID=A0ABU9YVY3_9RHOO
MDFQDKMRAALNTRKSAAAAKPAVTAVLDSADDASGSTPSDHFLTDTALTAAGVVQQWAATPADDLDDGETYADRLLALVVGSADANVDGELSDDEQGVAEAVLNAAFDYLVKNGVSEEDASAVLNDWDTAAADRVKDLLSGVLPTDDGAALDDIEAFAFGDDDQSAVFDAAYKKVFAVRHGKKLRINKRISGHVHLSAKQKVAIRKAGLKAHSATAKMRRAKSNRIRAKVGL